MRNLPLLAALALLAAGCNGGGADTGNVSAAEVASARTIKSPDQLPKDMPPEARRSAEGAMRASQAQQAQQESQMEAMKKATQGSH